MSVIENRPVVVTGAGHGIGAALAHEAAARSASAVAVCDIDLAAAESVARAIGDRAVAHEVDVTDIDAVFDLAAEIIAAHGLPGLVCANAGVAPAQGPTLDLDPTDARWVLGVNTIGVLTTLQAFGRRLVAGDEPGWLMATASEHALGRPHSGMGIYTASKHAVLGMCDVIRTELPEHVGISVLCPGLTQSDLAGAATHRPDSFGGAGQADAMTATVLARGMPAAEVAARALDGASAGHFLIPTHYNALAYAAARQDEVAEAFDRLAEIDTSNWDAEQVVADMLGELADDDN